MILECCRGVLRAAGEKLADPGLNICLGVREHTYHVVKRRRQITFLRDSQGGRLGGSRMLFPKLGERRTKVLKSVDGLPEGVLEPRKAE